MIEVAVAVVAETTRTAICTLITLWRQWKHVLVVMAVDQVVLGNCCAWGRVGPAVT